MDHCNCRRQKVVCFHSSWALPSSLKPQVAQGLLERREMPERLAQQELLASQERQELQELLALQVSHFAMERPQ
jgi:hypothetical protein